MVDATVIGNRFGGECDACDGDVPKGGGVAVRRDPRGEWRLYCLGCAKSLGYRLPGGVDAAKRRRGR